MLLLQKSQTTGFWTNVVTRNGKYVGELFGLHSDSACEEGLGCALHDRPSEHPLKNAPMYWREELGVVERTCSHDVSHPDYDNALYMERKGQLLETIHICDGCCNLYG